MRIVFPEPAMVREMTQDRRKASMGGITFSMNPQQATLCVPLGEDVSLEKPRGSSILMDLTHNVVIVRSVWRHEPISGFSLQVIACNQL